MAVLPKGKIIGSAYKSTVGGGGGGGGGAPSAPGGEGAGYWEKIDYPSDKSDPNYEGNSKTRAYRGLPEYKWISAGVSLGGGGDLGSYEGGYSSEMSSTIEEALNRYYAMQDYAKAQYEKSIVPSEYEPVYKGEFEQLDTEMEAVYAKLQKAATLVPDDEMLTLINNAAAPQQAAIRKQKDEAMQLNAAAWVRKGGSLSDPEFMKTQSKTAEPYDTAEQTLYQQLMTQMPKALYENYYSTYANLSAQKQLYLSGATSLDEAVRERMAGAGGTFMGLGTQAATSALGTGSQLELGLKTLAQQQSQYEKTFEESQKQWWTSFGEQKNQWLEEKKLAEEYAEAYEEANDPWSKFISGLPGMIGTIGGAWLGGPAGAAIGGTIGSAFAGTTASQISSPNSYYNSFGGMGAVSPYSLYKSGYTGSPGFLNTLENKYAWQNL